MIVIKTAVPLFQLILRRVNVMTISEQYVCCGVIRVGSAISRSWKLQKQAPLAGDIYATCPLEHKCSAVTQIHHLSSNGYYPSSNTTCTCSDPYGMQCIATCASNIRNHEIITIESDGTFQVVCPPSSVALGCGMRPYANGSDNFRSAFVVSERACQCSDDYGTACYAICGQFYWFMFEHFQRNFSAYIRQFTAATLRFKQLIRFKRY